MKTETTTMRKLITAMKISLDGKFEGPQGYADWVSAWSDDYGLTPEIDACVLGGRMYPGYEQYWTPIQDHPDQVHPRRRPRRRSAADRLPRDRGRRERPLHVIGDPPRPRTPQRRATPGRPPEPGLRDRP